MLVHIDQAPTETMWGASLWSAIIQTMAAKSPQCSQIQKTVKNIIRPSLSQSKLLKLEPGTIFWQSTLIWTNCDPSWFNIVDLGLCWLILVGVCWLVFVVLGLSWLIFVDLSKCWLILVGVNWCLLILVGPGWSLLIFQKLTQWFWPIWLANLDQFCGGKLPKVRTFFW